MSEPEFITLAHGGGGTRMLELLTETVFPVLEDPILTEAEDAAVLPLPGDSEEIALTTDCFVVKPLFFPGGDIGKLSVCGTVNDLAMRGARPLYLTLGLILEEGLPFDDLKRVLASIARTAREAGVRIVCGDTKVVEHGAADGIYINTTGVGVVPVGRKVSIAAARPGDVLIINGYIGDHGMAVLSRREGFSMRMSVVSDCAPLASLAEAMLEAGEVRVLRDPTRGGLAAACKEMAVSSACSIELNERDLPVREEVRAACELLGMDPLYLANEGKLLAAVAPQDTDAVLDTMHKHPLGGDARVIGQVQEGRRGQVSLLTPLGSHRLLRMPSGEQLPRIC